jgi:hypothetical protein
MASKNARRVPFSTAVFAASTLPSSVLVKKCLEMFASLAEDPEKYKKFYENFAKNLKVRSYFST